MAREDPHFRLRIPAELKERVEASAVANRRSTTAEIVKVLTDAFPAPENLAERIVEIENLAEVLRAAESNRSLSELSTKLQELLDDLSKGSVDGLSVDDRDTFEKTLNSAKYKNFLLKKKSYIDGTPVMSEHEASLPDWLIKDKG